jgi:hypothetical protein
MAPRLPAGELRPPFRLNGALKVGTNLGIGVVAYEIIRVFNSVNTRVRIKATAACTLDLIPLGPDVDQDYKGALAQLPGTQYTTGGNLAVAVAANTEVKSDLTLMGEGYFLVKVTMGAGAGVINYVDVCQLAYTR